MIELTRRLVEQNSHTANVAGANAVAAALRHAFALPSLDTEVIPGEGVGDHLVWRTRVPGPATMLIGHHDTVFPPGHFEGWTITRDRATGPGVLDMKGGLAVIWGALAALEATSQLAPIPIVVVSVSDEETGSLDSRRHLERIGAGARCALVFESGRPNDEIVTRRRGTGTLTVRFEGRAAHAGNAHADGVNALWAMARFIDTAQKLTDYGRGMTVNVGTAHAGTGSNTVPAHAECRVDLRFERHSDADELLAVIAAAAAAAAHGLGATSQVEGGINRAPLERTQASAQLFAIYGDCARAAGLSGGEMPIVGGGSDANTVAAIGVPVIDGLGVRGAGFHTTGEWADLTSFLPKAEALLRFLLRYAI